MISLPSGHGKSSPHRARRESMASMKDPLSSRWVQMVEQKFFCTILVAVGVGRAALSADRGQWLPGVPCCTTSSEPEAEGDRTATSLLRVLRAGADVALRSSIYPGSVPTGKVPINEIRKTPPFTLTTVPGKYQAVMPWPGVVFPESSRPPRPAQRFTHHAFVQVLPEQTNPRLLPSKLVPSLLLVSVLLLSSSLFLLPVVWPPPGPRPAHTHGDTAGHT